MLISEMSEEQKKEFSFLVRKMNRIYGIRTNTIELLGYADFKHLGPALIIADGRKKDSLCIRFITRKKQSIRISAKEPKYLKKVGRAQKLHDEDVDMLVQNLSRNIPGSDNITWDALSSFFDMWFKKYWKIKEMPDYSNLNAQ